MKNVSPFGLLVGLILAAPLWAQVNFNPAIGNQIVFDDTPVGETRNLDYAVTNNGRAAASVTLSTRAPFRVNVARIDMQGGGRGAFTISFTPQQVGRVNGALDISITIGGNVQRIQSTLIGTGIQGGPEITLDSDSLDLAIFADEFGMVWDFTELELVVTNTGAAALQVRSITSDVNWLTINPQQFNLNRIPIGPSQSLSPSRIGMRWSLTFMMRRSR